MALVSPRFEFCVHLYSSNLVAAIKHLERIQWLATMLANGLRHLPYEERLQRLVLHSLQRRRLRGDLIIPFQLYQRVYLMRTRAYFYTFDSTRPRRAPLQVTSGYEPSLEERFSFICECGQIRCYGAHYYEEKWWIRFGYKSFSISPVIFFLTVPPSFHQTF